MVQEFWRREGAAGRIGSRSSVSCTPYRLSVDMERGQRDQGARARVLDWSSRGPVAGAEKLPKAWWALWGRTPSLAWASRQAAGRSGC